MAIDPRLVVTGFRPDGAAVIAGDTLVTPITARALPGQEMYLMWGSPDGGATVGPKAAPPVTLPFFAGAGGTRLLLVRFPPASSVPPPSPEERAEIDAEVEERLPGLMDVFEPGDTSGMHTTDTLDYGICLEGELWLELDSGDEVRLTPGACVVQQGTRHAWHNRAATPALMAFVGIGAEWAS
ncbi:cupin domain-containing protein [Nonomuraea sp. PA05]|uniref:cupin domain-containing protein n=1 Tax=Nonomuraea sp. PA05 TaxID=2604466 RepID=UPI0011D378FE|nr:cupin domain-containing protein [Nonomuraea sp. PA05]TYB69189.1 cupin domain-containing protein [Nonomuraea sp. PA05]